MIFTKADREKLDVIDAKLTSIQSHLAGCTLVSLSSGLDKLMQSHAALEKSDSEMLESLTALTNGSKVVVNKFSQFVDVWNEFVRSVDKLNVTKPKRPAKSRKK